MIMIGLNALETLLRGYRWPSSPESAMQTAVAQALGDNELGFQREAELYPGSGRIDFLVTTGDGPIGIECKVDGSPSDVAEQLIRYAAGPWVVGLVLLTSRHTHGQFFKATHELSGKPFRLVSTFAGSF